MLVKFLFLLLMFLVRYVLCGSQYFLETSLKSCPEAQSKLRIMENVVGKIPEKPNVSLTLTAKPDPFETSDPTTQAKVLLRSDLFSSNHGEIIYYAFFITEENYSQPAENGIWDISKGWPPTPNWENSTVPYQVTPARWNPFVKAVGPDGFETAVYVLGDGSFRNSNFWNKPLTEETKYAFKIRAFTECGFQETDVIFFQTLKKLPALKIVSILISLWMITTIAVCCSIFHFEWIKRLGVVSGRKSKDYFSPVSEALSHKSFLKYAQDLLCTQGRLGNEFHLLGTLSSDVSTFCLHAQRVNNKPKNRYGNILPFDMTRVKLSIVDDDPSTDYINASFIKGYTEQIEYIACQEPQEETCHDFYRMILEQSVELIIMLTGLNQSDKEKYYKYYPGEGKALQIKDITIICNKVEKFDFYKKRTLFVTRGDKKLTVTHFQHRQWPDFSCPKNVEDTLEFCDAMHRTQRRGYVVVHCSAGAGRTGTFVAVDILLQRVKNNNKINVFNTVLKLRQQRVGMVQTETQLGYIYKCISQAIEGSSPKNKETV